MSQPESKELVQDVVDKNIVEVLSHYFNIARNEHVPFSQFDQEFSASEDDHCAVAQEDDPHAVTQENDPASVPHE